jgi:chloramphenicol-sensitive protein RarD
MASAVLVGANWLFYVLCVHYHVIVQASLGYFILPLVNVALGLVLFRERLRPLQHLAIVLGLVGVSVLTYAVGAVPWLSLGIAFTFGFYGLIRKHVPVDGLIGLTVETIVLLPATLTYLAVGYASRMEAEAPELLFKLSLSGVVTAVPLVCFGEAARRLPFTMLGLMQYLAPSVQFLLALWLFEEEVQDWTGYVIVWAALAVFSIDSYFWLRAEGRLLETKTP